MKGIKTMLQGHPQSSKKPQYVPQLPPLKIPAPLAVTQGYAKTLGADPETGFHDIPEIRATVRARDYAAQAWDSFAQLRKNRNPGLTPAAFLNQLEKQHKSMERQIFAKVDAAKNDVQRRKLLLDEEINKRLMGSHTEDAAEIRAVLRSLPDDQRYAAIKDAVDNNDQSILGATFRGRALTLGLSQKQLDGLRDYASKKLAADLHSQKELLDKAEKILIDVTTATIELSDYALGNPEAKKFFAEDAARADEAMAKFSAALLQD
jgi:hypothetical protein